MEFSGKLLEWVAFPFTGDVPNPGIETRSPTLQADSWPSKALSYIKELWTRYQLSERSVECLIEMHVPTAPPLTWQIWIFADEMWKPCIFNKHPTWSSYTPESEKDWIFSHWQTMAYGPNSASHLFLYNPVAKNGFHVFCWLKRNQKNNNSFRYVEIFMKCA